MDGQHRTDTQCAGLWSPVRPSGFCREIVNVDGAEVGGCIEGWPIAQLILKCYGLTCDRTCRSDDTQLAARFAESDGAVAAGIDGLDSEGDDALEAGLFLTFGEQLCCQPCDFARRFHWRPFEAHHVPSPLSAIDIQRLLSLTAEDTDYASASTRGRQMNEIAGFRCTDTSAGGCSAWSACGGVN